MIKEMVKSLLEQDKESRNLNNLEFIKHFSATFYGIDLDLKFDPETVRRCKQDLCEKNPAFRANDMLLQTAKDEKQKKMRMKIFD